MSFPRIALLITAIVLFSSGTAGATEVMLKIACVEQDALDEFTLPQTGAVPVIDYRILSAALNDAASVRTGSGNSSLVSTRRIACGVRDIPAALQALYPEQANVIGQQTPGGSSSWHKLIIDFSANQRIAFIELGVDQGALDSLATGTGAASLRNRPIQQYTRGGDPEPDAVFTTGYSVFLQQISGPGGRQWLERVMPLRDGIAVLGLRRSGTQTRTDTLIIRIDAARLPPSLSGMPRVLVVAGWER